MSIDAARNFLKRIDTDQALQERLKTAPGLEARKKIIRAAGFEFNLAEYKQAIEEAAAAAGQELTAEELEAVAGGLGTREAPGRLGLIE
ncbi:MAG: Nif11-like leader peptide family RiPP precursor [Syntrophales bacterium]|nr:Nif11-like leader peptide family RiPP precursor [Syntrophales bacterium]MDD5640207.1 Nif11-like leader peptide family RiPP precursor [Syntrophales bacterium]